MLRRKHLSEIMSDESSFSLHMDTSRPVPRPWTLNRKLNRLPHSIGAFTQNTLVITNTPPPLFKNKLKILGVGQFSVCLFVSQFTPGYVRYWVLGSPAEIRAPLGKALQDLGHPTEVGIKKFPMPIILQFMTLLGLQEKVYSPPGNKITPLLLSV